MPAKSRYIATLDGWRAVAILMVLVQHGTISAGNAFPLLSKLGPHGVQIFFVLSGFLITTRLLEDGCNLGRFYTRRVFRILPLACLYLSILWLLRDRLPVGRGELFSSLFFARNYTISSTLPSDGQGWFTLHFWSLALEEQFYLLWPPLLAFAGERRARSIAASCGLSILAWRITCTFLGPSLYSSQFAWNLRPEFHFDSLFLGCALALWWPQVREWPKDFLEKIGVGSLLAWCALVGLTAGFPSTLEAASAAGIIATTAICFRSLPARLLESLPFRLVGRISYGLYVWQQLFLIPKAMGHPLGRLQSFPLNFISLASVAVLSYYGFERPLLNVGRQLKSRRIRSAT